VKKGQVINDFWRGKIVITKITGKYTYEYKELDRGVI